MASPQGRRAETTRLGGGAETRQGRAAMHRPALAVPSSCSDYLYSDLMPPQVLSSTGEALQSPSGQGAPPMLPCDSTQ